MMRKDGKGERYDEKSKENVVGEILQDALVLSSSHADESWVLDSGASYHAIPCRSYFINYVQGDFGQVYLGDGHPCHINGKETIQIRLPNGNHM